MQRSQEPTDNDLRYPRIPKAPRLPRLYTWVPQDEEETTRDAAAHLTHPTWAGAARECAAVCLAGVAAVLLQS